VIHQLPTPQLHNSQRTPNAQSPTPKALKRNGAASLLDLDDGVLQIEFHSKLNTIGGDTIEMLNVGVREGERNFAALVVGPGADNFAAGANLMLLLREAHDGNWNEVDLMVRAFQGMTMALRLAPVPVVVAPAGLAIGGGCEIVLHAARVQSAAEAYIGLVEAGGGPPPPGRGPEGAPGGAVEGPPPPARRPPPPAPLFPARRRSAPPTLGAP